MLGGEAMTPETVDVTYPVDVTDLPAVRRVLNHALTSITDRAVQAAERGEWSGPTVAIEIEECHRVLADADVRAAVERIARLGRKTGYLIVLHGSGATPLSDGGPPLHEFGGSCLLRDMAVAGRSVVYRPNALT